jgi:outer membrane receptor protein involved in Fe transport
MPMNKIVIFIIILSFNLWPAVNETQITGKIVDKNTGIPLSGADVYLSHSKCGTTTDNDGWFRLFCSQTDTVDTLLVSYLGYHTYRTYLKKYKNTSVIYLIPESLDLNDEIVISAERIDIFKQDIPLVKNTIKLEEIEQYGSSEIGDILKPLPSVRIEGNDLDGRTIQIRGSDADEVKVYLDGVLLNNLRTSDAADLSIIPVESIESLEVLRGGNSALLGQGAFGGVVNITTRQETETHLYLKGKIGSFTNRYFIGNLTIPLKKRFIVNYYGQVNSMSPQIEYFPDERFTEKTTNTAITTDKQNHIVNLNYFGEKGQISSHFIGYLFKYNKPLWNSIYRNYLFDASYQGEILGLKDFEIGINQLFTQDKITRKPEGSSQYINNYHTNQANVRIAKKFSFQTGDFQFLSEYYHDELLNDSKIKDLDWESQLSHGFVYDNRASVAGVVSFRDALKTIPTFSWNTYLGLRGDFVASGNRDASVLSGVQINYNLEHWKFSPYFNYGKNVKYPTLWENAYIRDLTNFAGTDTTIKRLKPEYNSSAELGITLKFYPKSTFYRDLDYTFALFTRTVYNKLLSRPFDDVIAQVQIGRNVTRGFETSLRFDELFKWFTFTAAYIQIHLTDPLLYSYKPDKNLSLHLGCYSSFGLYFTSTFFYEGKSSAWFYDSNNVFQTEAISPFFDADVSLGFKIPIKGTEMDLQVSGYNIFDNSGFRYYYLKKRNIQFSISFKY